MTVTAPVADRATWGSGVRSSYGYAVPRRFLWLADLVIPCLAFLLARAAAPWLQTLVSPGGLLYSDSPGWLSIQGGPGGLNPLADVLWILPVVMCTTVVFMEVLGGYQPLLEQSRLRLVTTSLGAPLLSLSLVSLILTTLKLGQISRAFVFSLALFSALGILAYRLGLRRYKYKRLVAGCFAKNVVVIGSPFAVRWVEEFFAREVSPRFYRLCGHLALALPPVAPITDCEVVGSAAESPYLGTVSELGHLLVNRPIHQVVAVESEGASDWLPNVIEQCQYFRLPLRIVPEVLLSSPERSLTEGNRAHLDLPAVVIRAPHLDSDALFAKRVLDVVVSAALLALLSPLFLLIAIAIKLTTPGLTVFYPWRVVGYKGREFTGYKFTTMAADADQRKAELMHLNEMSGPVFKIANDPRVTPLGRILRKYSLNELPQLWSVLKGDMSLVGPRPAYPTELARYELWQKRKLCVQPGITCLWQIRGRNKIANFDDWVRMDFEYLDNWSLWLDVVILAKTVWAVVRGSGS